MLLSDFDYKLPEELIAQSPLSERDQSRLLVVNRLTEELQHKHFYDLPNLLDPKTVIVLNNTKVFKARLFGRFDTDQNQSEVFLVQKVGDDIWECMTHPGRKFYPNKRISFLPTGENAKEAKPLQAIVTRVKEDGNRILQFSANVEEKLDMYGHTPLPPYIKQESSPDRYQTVFAKQNGSVAAPTAGLHFTNTIFTQLKERGIEIAETTLHVGLGTFVPVKTENIEDHIMHKELFTLSKETAEVLNQKKQDGYKILAVGTTSNRVLETCSTTDGVLLPQSAHTDLFIYPGYQFKFTDILLTNFHLPKSTLIMLVSAFAGKELMQKAYAEAIKEQYRFFSFGDAMLII